MTIGTSRSLGSSSRGSINADAIGAREFGRRDLLPQSGNGTPIRVAGSIGGLQPASAKSEIMFFKLYRAVCDRAADAKAVQIHEEFLKLLDPLDDPELPGWVPEMIAAGFVQLLTRYADSVRIHMPAHCQERCLLYVEKRSLKSAAEHYFRLAESKSAQTEVSEKLSGLSAQFIGYFLLARSWQDIGRAPSAVEADALESAPLFGTRIEMKLETFLEQQGHQMPIV